MRERVTTIRDREYREEYIASTVARVGTEPELKMV